VSFRALGFAGASLRLEYLNVGRNSNFWTINLYYVVKFTEYFGTRMVAFLYRDRIPLRKSLFLVAVGLLFVASFRQGLGDTLFVFILGYGLLYLGYSRRVRLSWLTKSGDFSHGTYIWAFPVSQTLIHYYGKIISLWPLIRLISLTTLCFAVLSWFFVEKPALALKIRVYSEGVWFARLGQPDS
jgi:peptidoglycan/LPS O-acetylase OafA/YrhL